MIAAELDAGVLDIFGELREEKRFLARRRRECLYLLYRVIRLLLRRVEFEHTLPAQFFPNRYLRFREISREPCLVFPSEIERRAHAVLFEECLGLRSNAPDLVDGEMGEVPVGAVSRDDRNARWLFPFRADLGNDFIRPQAHGNREAQRS